MSYREGGGMQRRNFGIVVTGLLLAATVLLAGCGSSQESGNSARDDISIAVISHGQASNPFFSALKNGATQAGQDLGVSVTYSATQKSDPVEMKKLLDAAIANEPDGIALSLLDVEAFRPSIEKAQRAGISVVAFNIGQGDFQDLGIPAYVGQDEFTAGVEAGRRLTNAGVTKAFCVNPGVGAIWAEARCGGFEKGFEGEVRVLGVSEGNPTDTQAKIEAAMKANPDFDGMLAIGPVEGQAALAALEETGSDMPLGVFDLSEQILQAIKSGRMLFAIDQQQYLQGYLPVAFLVKNEEVGVMPKGVVSTGPGVVTKENAQQVIELTKEGLR